MITAEETRIKLGSRLTFGKDCYGKPLHWFCVHSQNDCIVQMFDKFECINDIPLVSINEACVMVSQFNFSKEEMTRIVMKEDYPFPTWLPSIKNLGANLQEDHIPDGHFDLDEYNDDFVFQMFQNPMYRNQILNKVGCVYYPCWTSTYNTSFSYWLDAFWAVDSYGHFKSFIAKCKILARPCVMLRG